LASRAWKARGTEQDKTVDERFQVLQAVDAPHLKREMGKW
jgi:hypothetical protein